MDKLKMEPVDPENGEHMTIKDFLENVNSGFFIDYDGYGDLATATEVSNIKIWPSDVKDIKPIDPRWTHVMWYNR